MNATKKIALLFSAILFAPATMHAQGPPPIVWSGGGHVSGIRSVATSPDGRMVATASFNDQTVKLWDTASGRLRRTLQAHVAGIQSTRLSSCGA